MALTRDFLRFQGARLERAQGDSISPRWMRFALELPFGLKLARVPGLSPDLALAADEARAAEDGDGDEVGGDVPRPDADALRLPALLKSTGALASFVAVLGLADDARPLLLRLTSPGAAHVLVTGDSGAGKTELLRAMLMALALNNRQSRLQMALADPRSRGFTPLAGLPHLIADVASDAGAARALLERLDWEMDRREAEAVAEPRILVAVDEIIDVLSAGGVLAEDILVRLTRFGRDSGMHLLAGTRQPAAALEALPTARFPVRLVGHTSDAREAEAAAGQSASGADKLLGRGDFLCLSGGQVVPFQAAWAPATDWAALAAEL